jgi:hypothetical protein
MDGIIIRLCLPWLLVLHDIYYICYLTTQGTKESIILATITACSPTTEFLQLFFPKGSFTVAIADKNGCDSHTLMLGLHETFVCLSSQGTKANVTLGTGYNSFAYNIFSILIIS